MNEKWFSLSVPEIEKKLKTNAALGLSHKAARSRYSHQTESLVDLPRRSPFLLARELLEDFSVIIILIMSLVALFFDERATGGVVLALIAINLAVSAFIYYRVDAFSASSEEFFAPRCKVIREGKLYLIDSRYVVLGDVIMVSEGDILPCDARIVSSDSLFTLMRVDEKSHLFLDKQAEGVVAPNENDVTKYSNMLHAGSLVTRGSGRAIVTAVGRYTYIGARQLKVARASAGRTNKPKILVEAKKYTSALSFWLLLASLPLSIVGLIVGGDKISLFSAFMIVLALSVSLSPQLATTVYRLFFAIATTRCILARDPAVVRSHDALDKLACTRFLFMLDGAALTDGVLHFDKAVFADSEVSDLDSDSSENTQRLAELCALYLGAEGSALLSQGGTHGRYDKGMSELIEGTHCDRDALKIRCSVSGFMVHNSIDPHDKLFYNDFGERRILFVSYNENAIEECSYALAGGERVLLDDAKKKELIKKHRALIASGHRLLIFSFARNEGYGNTGERCLVALIAFAERADMSAKKAITALAARGVRTVFFRDISVNGRQADVSRVPESLLGENRADIRDFVAAEKSVTHGLGKINSYSSFSDEQVCELVEALHKNGETVTVVGFSEKYEKIYRVADVVVTSSNEKYTLEGVLEDEIKILESADELTSKQAPQCTKQIADVVIPRPQGFSGGLSSLLTTVSRGQGAYRNIATFFKYVVAAGTLRTAMLMRPMLFGTAVLDSRHLLLCGMLIDLAVLLCFAFDSGVERINARALLRDITTPIRSNIRLIVFFSVGAFVSTLLPQLVALIPSFPAYVDKTEYSFITLMFFHVALFLSLKLERGGVIREGLDKSLVLLPAFALAITALCFVGGIADAFGIEGFSSVIYLLIAPISPLITSTLYLLSLKKGKKK